MLPYITKIRKSEELYKYGFRWIVKAKDYSTSVRTFKNALGCWKKEIKRAIPKWFFIEHDFYFHKYDNEECY